MNKKAFTLIELLAVIVIIAIIALIGVFSVTKIMNKSRMNTLSATALAVKKVAKLYLSSNEINDDLVLLNMTPGTGADANLIDISADPWGKTYEYVLASITKESSNVYSVNVYLGTSIGVYQLSETVDVEGRLVVNDALQKIGAIPVEVMNKIETNNLSVQIADNSTTDFYYSLRNASWTEQLMPGFASTVHGSAIAIDYNISDIFFLACDDCPTVKSGRLTTISFEALTANTNGVCFGVHLITSSDYDYSAPRIGNAVDQNLPPDSAWHTMTYTFTSTGESSGIYMAIEDCCGNGPVYIKNINIEQT